MSLVAVACFLPGRAKDLSAPRYKSRVLGSWHITHKLFLWFVMICSIIVVCIGWWFVTSTPFHISVTE